MTTSSPMPPKIKLDFVIIGAQKSASTFLQALISSHPDIYMPDGETPYFQDPDYSTSRLPEYLDIPQNREIRSIGIKRPNYIGPDGEPVPERIYKHNKKCIIIAVLRNPIDRFVSSFYHNVRGAYGPVANVEDILPKLLNNDQEFANNYPRMKECLTNGLYGKYLENYYSKFPRENILVYTQEEITGNPHVAIRQIYEKLGVNPSYVPSNKILKSRPQSVDYRIRSLFFLQYISKISYKYNRERTRRLKYYRKSMPRKIAIYLLRGLRVILDRGGLLGKNKKPTLSRKSIELLKEYYRNDLLFAEQLIQKDLNFW